MTPITRPIRWLGPAMLILALSLPVTVTTGAPPSHGTTTSRSARWRGTTRPASGRLTRRRRP